jgi:hypothetical protein
MMNGSKWKSMTMLLTAPLIAAALATLGGCDRLDDVIRDHLSGDTPRGDVDGRGGASGGGSSSCREGKGADGLPCRMCVDETGRIVVDTCTREPGSPPLRCGIEDLGGGVVCTICYDAETGAAKTRECRTPSDTPGPISTCDIRTDRAGAMCRICYDAAGVVVHDGCNPPPPSDPAPAPTRCERVTDESGVVCSICYDASGTAVRRECAPAPQ